MLLGMQDLVRKMHGVASTRVGYTGGTNDNPTYRNHGSHAEALEVVFNPNELSFRELLEFFFQVHDPSTLNRQGNDRGASYRSAVFYTSDEQRAVAQQTIVDVDASGLWPGKVVTSNPCRGVLGGRGRTPGLPDQAPQRLHMPLRPPRLEVASR